MSKDDKSKPPIPDVVIPCSKLHIVKKPSIPAAGIEFIGPDGKAYFVWLEGVLLSAIAEQLLEFVKRNPEVLSWKLPKGQSAP